MKKRARLNVELLESVKRAFIPIPGGTDPSTGGPPGGADPNAMPPQGMPPGDPSMGGGMPPGGAPPMDPSMGGMPPGGAPPMDPSMGGGMPPGGDPNAGGAPPMDPAAGGDPTAQLASAGIDPAMMGGGGGGTISISEQGLLQLISLLTGKGGPSGDPAMGGAEKGTEGGAAGGGAPKPKKASTDDIMNALNNLTSQLGGGGAAPPAPAPAADPGMTAQAFYNIMNKRAGIVDDVKEKGKQGIDYVKKTWSNLTTPTDLDKRQKKWDDMKSDMDTYWNRFKKGPKEWEKLKSEKKEGPKEWEKLKSEKKASVTIKEAYLAKRAGFIDDIKAKGKEVWNAPLKDTVNETVEGGKNLVNKGVSKTKELYNKGKKKVNEYTSAKEAFDLRLGELTKKA